MALCACAAGGVHNGEYVSWLYCYDPIMDVWARKQDMNTKRAIHALAGMNDRLYAIGGNHLKGKALLGSEGKTGQQALLFFTVLKWCERDAAIVWQRHFNVCSATHCPSTSCYFMKRGSMWQMRRTSPSVCFSVKMKCGSSRHEKSWSLSNPDHTFAQFRAQRHLSHL